MPATQARFDFCTREFRVATAGPDTSIDTAFGALARKDDSTSPFETFFAATADTQAMATERYDLLRAVRRRFVVDLSRGSSSSSAAAFSLALDNSQVAVTATLLDTPSGANFAGIVAGASINLRTGEATLDIWG